MCVCVCVCVCVSTSNPATHLAGTVTEPRISAFERRDTCMKRHTHTRTGRTIPEMPHRADPAHSDALEKGRRAPLVPDVTRLILGLGRVLRVGRTLALLNGSEPNLDVRGNGRDVDPSRLSTRALHPTGNNRLDRPSATVRVVCVCVCAYGCMYVCVYGLCVWGGGGGGGGGVGEEEGEGGGEIQFL